MHALGGFLHLLASLLKICKLFFQDTLQLVVLVLSLPPLLQYSEVHFYTFCKAFDFMNFF